MNQMNHPDEFNDEDFGDLKARLKKVKEPELESDFLRRLEDQFLNTIPSRRASPILTALPWLASAAAILLCAFCFNLFSMEKSQKTLDSRLRLSVENKLATDIASVAYQGKEDGFGILIDKNALASPAKKLFVGDTWKGLKIISFSDFALTFQSENGDTLILYSPIKRKPS